MARPGAGQSSVTRKCSSSLFKLSEALPRRHPSLNSSQILRRDPRGRVGRGDPVVHEPVTAADHGPWCGDGVTNCTNHLLKCFIRYRGGLSWRDLWSRQAHSRHCVAVSISMVHRSSYCIRDPISLNACPAAKSMPKVRGIVRGSSHQSVPAFHKRLESGPLIDMLAALVYLHAQVLISDIDVL